MNISLEYFAQVRRSAGTGGEELEVRDGSGLRDALGAAAALHGSEFRALVLDDDGAVRPSIVVLVNGTPARRDGNDPLAAGDTIALLSAVAGG